MISGGSYPKVGNCTKLNCRSTMIKAVDMANIMSVRVKRYLRPFELRMPSDLKYHQNVLHPSVLELTEVAVAWQ